MRERRRYPRYDTALEVKYSTKGNASIESYTVSKNVSRIGLRLPLTRLIKEGDILDLDIKTDAKNAPVSALGKVVWTRTINRPAPLELDAGIEFVKINPIDAGRLVQPAY